MSDTGTQGTDLNTLGPSTALSPAQQQSAHDFITAYLGQFGLSGLADNVWQSYLGGQPVSEIMLNVRNTPEYQARFPAMKALSAKGEAWSEAEYMSYEQSVRSSLAAAGIPSDTGFYEPDYIAKFIEGDVAPAEVNARIQEAAQATKIDAYSQAAQRIYGVDSGHLTALFLDPTVTQPIIDRKFGAVQAAGEAQGSHYGQLSQQEAEYLAQFNLSADQERKQFGDLAALPTGNLAGESDQNSLDKQTQLDYVQGQNYAQQRINNRREQLASTTQGSAQFSNDKTGSGIGSAQQPG